jgi:hypothetical protein
MKALSPLLLEWIEIIAPVKIGAACRTAPKRERPAMV